ncbi:MAG: acyltransferase [Bacteroidales bacterium]|jgi:acetyltransferase-like isoleucine patch superfamily enzyme|nr:acyltransferase [Bacteroidales bacterium]
MRHYFALLKKVIKYLPAINRKTLSVNFKNLAFKDAIRLPILLSHRVKISDNSGLIVIDAPLSTGMIRIGFGDVGIFDHKRTRTILQNPGKIIFHGTASIGFGSSISIGNNGVLELGNNFAITAKSAIMCQKHIVFGNDCLISWDCLFMDSDFHTILDKTNNMINHPKDIIVGNHVWIGCRCLILKGTEIADHIVIGANSTVTNVLQHQNSVYSGNPARCVKEDITWEEKME